MGIFSIDDALACTGNPTSEDIPDVTITGVSGLGGTTATFRFVAESTQYLSGYQCHLYRSNGLTSIDDYCVSPKKYEDLSEGTYTFKVAAYYDGIGSEPVYGDDASYTWTVLDDEPEPTAPTVTLDPSISPTNPTINEDTLTCDEGTWEGSPTSHSYQWRRDSSNISGATSSTYAVDFEDDEKKITCKVIASNSAGSSQATSDPVTPKMPAPVMDQDPYISPSDPTVGDTLTCNKGVWQNMELEASSTEFSYLWLRDDNSVASATNSTYGTTSSDENKQITCLVTANNSGGSVTSTSPAAFVESDIQPPSVTLDPSISPTNPTINEDTLTCDKGTWTESPTSHSYQWRRDGSNISGATSSTYAVDFEDDEKKITCKVIASNSAGSSQATSDPVTPKMPAPVMDQDPYISPSDPTVGDTLTCNKGVWQNMELEASSTEFSYLWRRDGSNISGATSVTYKTISTDAYTSINCIVTARNSGGTKAVESNSVTPTRGMPISSNDQGSSGADSLVNDEVADDTKLALTGLRLNFKKVKASLLRKKKRKLKVRFMLSDDALVQFKLLKKGKRCKKAKRGKKKRRCKKNKKIARFSVKAQVGKSVVRVPSKVIKKLKGGSYIFKVAAKNDEGTTSKSRSLKLKVLRKKKSHSRS